MKKYKYLNVFALPIATWIAFINNGFLTYLPLFLFFVIVPTLEFFFKPDHSNIEEVEKRLTKEDPFYTRLLYLTVPIQVSILIAFLLVIEQTVIGSVEFYGRISSMGIMCGIMGINIGHELGHRSNKFAKILGEIALLTSLEMHFIPYHNSGHHFNVATPNDPATARKSEWLYIFWFRSQIGSYFQAWQIENRRLKKKKQSTWSFSNNMVRYTILQLGLLMVIFFVFNWVVLLAFMAAATIGILLLETVNYIEHYGLVRKVNENGRYEKVQHHHSWNSDHIIGRIFLFELSRHSDHHYKASTHYQVLESLPQSPQMPTGYPGMVLFALFPPLWIPYMNARLPSGRVHK